MRLGIVARCDDTGLGNQTREAVRHMKPDKLLVVDISSMNGNPQHPEWYEEQQALFTRGFPTRGDIDWFLRDLDVVFVAESPYNYELYSMARERGVKVAVQYNYEFFDWFMYPHYPKPDMFIAPSKWHYDRIDQWCKANNIRHMYLHCPVNRDVIPYQVPTGESKQARSFLHIAGKPAVHDRNGTLTFIAAAAELKRRGTNARFAISTQDAAMRDHILEHAGFIRIKMPEEHYWDNYDTEDVLVMPRRYGGNCMPTNEALSAGMPVIMPHISPNNMWLPHHWLTPATKIGEFQPRTTIDIFEANTQALVDKIDWFTERADYEHESQLANRLADSISWETMLPMYQTALGDLCSQ